jgi:hypothetical protein
VAGEYLGWSQEEVDRRVSEIAPRLGLLLDRAREEGACTEQVAHRMARDVINDAARRRRAA